MTETVFRESRRRRRAQLAAARQGRDEALSPMELRLTGDVGPLMLLNAALPVIPFRGRMAELTALGGWDGADAHAGMLVIGPAGVGKSRLAYRHGLALPQEWARGELRPGHGGQIVRLAHEAGDPTLIVVDDGGASADLTPLMSALAEHDGTPLIQALVVARSAQAVRALIGPQLSERHRHILDQAEAAGMLLSPSGNC
ncbi:hypothetical protein [Nonomuraea insulae]|uniref:AAA+ ATPase domain-containing protein n=1 Tax=Nonomuraea insulae TaxID=1616787 RepID=A0ABW1D7E4_9ACTN